MSSSCFSILFGDLLIWEENLSQKVATQANADIDSILFTVSHSHSTISGLYYNFMQNLLLGWKDKEMQDYMIEKMGSAIAYTRKYENQVQVDVRSESISLSGSNGQFEDRLRGGTDIMIPISTVLIRNSSSHEMEGIMTFVSTHPTIYTYDFYSPSTGGYLAAEFAQVYLNTHSITPSSSFVSSFAVGAVASVRKRDKYLGCSFHEDSCVVEMTKCGAATLARIMVANMCGYDPDNTNDLALGNDPLSFSFMETSTMSSSTIASKCGLSSYNTPISTSPSPIDLKYCSDWTSSAQIGWTSEEIKLPVWGEYRFIRGKDIMAPPPLISSFLPRSQYITAVRIGDLMFIGIPGEVSLHIPNEVLNEFYSSGTNELSDSTNSISHFVVSAFNRDWCGYYVKSEDYDTYTDSLECYDENFVGRNFGDHMEQLLRVMVGLEE
ncbi:hypothetical protein ADUPG1_011903 [Aduncisulcus paluster]|uniref:Neutral/alkaline non-lysosomal ceramidase N-terminal domain-containing protein n=1 Tax=Aduncisulcus paluster TaxID=2918883 RepID=A0ABQ5JXK9_9EUKA|nr:hypothetical protein ADUPG1_011903 [Aduncisulcus paluster]